MQENTCVEFTLTSPGHAGEIGWWKGIQVHDRGRLHSCGVHVTLRLKSEVPEAFEVFNAVNPRKGCAKT